MQGQVFFDVKKPPALCLAKLVCFDESIKLFSQSSSLTDQIKNLCATDFRFKIIKNSSGALSDPPLPYKPFAQTGIIRDVYLCCGHQKLIYARSFLPLSSLKGYWRCLQSLKRPLGTVLFHHRYVKREFLGFYSVAYPKACLGRFLRFHLPTGPILVTEWVALKKDLSTPY
jgi:chorismate-pyruvate lyase